MIEQIFTFLGGATFSILIVGGLIRWQGKVWANRILEQDRAKYQTEMHSLLQSLRTAGEKDIFKHRLQFEKEFEVYRDLWKRLLEVNRAASEFRTITKASDKTHAEQIENFRTSINELQRVVFDNRPFYSRRVFDISKETLDNLNGVYKRVADRLRSPIYEDEIEDNIEKAHNAITDVCDAIRKRIVPDKDD